MELEPFNLPHLVLCNLDGEYLDLGLNLLPFLSPNIHDKGHSQNTLTWFLQLETIHLLC